MNPRISLAILIPVFVAFVVYTLFVVAGHGFTFVELALREAWGGQMLVDLVIALVLFATWMREDASERGLPYWPYLVLILATGSIGALAYLIHRGLRAPRAAAVVRAS